MNLCRLLSDQLNAWSDTYEQQIRFRSPQTPTGTAASTPAPGRRSARVAYRALQTLRQARMQVRQRSWSRPQVLSLGGLPGLETPNGLRTTTRLQPHQRVVGQLPAGPRHLREGLRDQPRTAAPPRATLKNCHERYAYFARPSFRFAIRWRATRQYDRGL